MSDPTPAIYDIGDTITLTCVFLTNATLGAISPGSNQLSLKDSTGYVQGDTVIVVGAGTVGGDLVTTVSSVSGSVLTLAAVAQTRVNAAQVGRLANPATVTCKVREPNGTISTPPASNVTIGKFQASFDVAQAGDHYYEFSSTGTAKGEEERMFVVRQERLV